MVVINVLLEILVFVKSILLVILLKVISIVGDGGCDKLFVMVVVSVVGDGGDSVVVVIRPVLEILLVVIIVVLDIGSGDKLHG